jgi:hypothetical protein
MELRAVFGIPTQVAFLCMAGELTRFCCFWSATCYAQTSLSISFLVSCGGVRLSPLGTSATIWPIVPAPDDRWWMWSTQWNNNWHGKLKYSEKTCPNFNLSATNPTWARNLAAVVRCRQLTAWAMARPSDFSSSSSPLPSKLEEGYWWHVRLSYSSSTDICFSESTSIYNSLCGLVVRVPGYRFRGPGIDFRHYQIFWEVVGLEQGPLSLVRIIE